MSILSDTVRRPRFGTILTGAFVPALPWVAGLLWLVASFSPLPVRALAACVLAVAAVRFPRVGLLVACAAAPFDGYTQAAVIHGNLLFIDALLGGAIAGYAWEGRLDRWHHGHAIAVGALALLVAWQAASVLSLARLALALDALDNVGRLAFFTVLFACLGTVRDDALRTRGLSLLVLGAAVRFVWEAVPFFQSPQFVWHQSYQFGRWTSNPNTLAGLAAPLLAVALGEVHRRGKAIDALLWGLPVAILAGGITLSFSKSAWLAAAAAGVPFLFWVTRPRRAAWVGGLLVALLTATPISGIANLMYQRWVSAGTARSNAERLLYAEQALAMVREHPVAGVGLEGFADAYRGVVPSIGGPDDPHNLYLLLASELGGPALILACCFFVTVLYRRARAAAGGDQTALLLTASTVSILVFQLFSAEPWASRVTWLLLAWPIADVAGADRRELPAA